MLTAHLKVETTKVKQQQIISKQVSEEKTKRTRRKNKI
jgi:hypothetical protein